VVLLTFPTRRSSDLLDRVEIGRIGWQEPEPCACGHYHLADGGRLVRAEIVHDDDVARFEHRRELLLDIGAEALAVNRPVEDARGDRKSTRLNSSHVK